MKTAAQIVAQFEADVTKIIRKAWPQLVSEQLLKVGSRPVTRAKLTASMPKVVIVPKYIGACADALSKFGSKMAAAKAMGLAETTYRDRLKKELSSSDAKQVGMGRWE